MGRFFAFAIASSAVFDGFADDLTDDALLTPILGSVTRCERDDLTICCGDVVTPEYDQAMIRKAREARGEPTDDQTSAPKDDEGTPDPGPDIPDKFKNEDGTVNVDALAQSYRELESRMSDKDSQQQQQAAQQTDEDTKTMAEKAGLDFEDLKSKVQTNGEIDESDYEAFEKIGVPRNLVEEVIQFRQQQAEQIRSQALDYIGGEEEATSLMKWAGENLTQPEIDTYNEMLNSTDWKAAIDRLKSLQGLSSKTAGEPKLTQPGEQNVSNTDGFATREDMRAALADPRYSQQTPEGERYRQEVMRKVANSPKEVRKPSG